MLNGETEQRVLLTMALIAAIIDGLDAAGIGIASGTYESVGMPKLEVQVENRA